MSSQQPLLDSIAEVARAIFGAKAASIMLHDADAGELVFAAVAGEGSETLIGHRIPEATGVSGWVFSARQPVVIEDVAKDPRFSDDVAQMTGYMPKGLMAAPLLRDERALGVLSVLDRPKRAGFSLMEMDLLGLFANQAAIALESGSGRSGTGQLAELEARLEGLDGERRRQAETLLNALAELL
jgi:GAF domain-containing protein